MTHAVIAQALEKRYRRRPWEKPRPVVSGFDLRVRAGGITGLLGPGSAGKSTVMKMLLGLVRPARGCASVLGHDCARESLAVRRAVAYVPQDRGVFGRMRCVEFAGAVAACSVNWDAALASRLFSRWRIDPHARLRDLSPGARSQLLFLVALARRTPLLFLDEPTSGMDPGVADDTLSRIASAAADGVTVLLATHRLDEVERICDRVTIMNGGRIQLDADLDDLRAGWRAIDIARFPAVERLRGWEGVLRVSGDERAARLVVRGDVDAVVARLHTFGAEVTGVRSMALREVYLHATGENADGARDDLA